MPITKYLLDTTDYDDECQFYVFFIPKKAVSILAGLTNRLKWKSSYRDDISYDNGVILWEYLQNEYGRRLIMCEITEALNRIADGTECICAALNGSQSVMYSVTPQTQLILDASDEFVTYNPVITPTSPIFQDEDRCAIAQGVWQASLEMLTEWVIPAQSKAIDYLLPLFFALVASWLIAIPPVAISVGAITALCWALIDGWADGQLDNVYNKILSYKDELVCAMYNGLLFGTQEAINRVDAVIDTMGLSAGDTLIFKLMFAGWTFSIVESAWTAQNEWILSILVPDYCTICEDSGTYHWTFPPCPNTWVYGATPHPNNYCDNRGYLHYGDMSGCRSEVITLTEQATGVWGRATYMFDDIADEGGWFDLLRRDGSLWTNALPDNAHVLTMSNPDNVKDTEIENCGLFPDVVLPPGDYRVLFLDGVFNRTFATSCTLVLGGTLPTCEN